MQKQGFIENQGQITDQNGNPRTDILYLFDLPNTKVFLKKTGFSYQFYHPPKKNGKDSLTPTVITSRVDAEWLNANKNIDITPCSPYKAVSNYYSTSLNGPVNSVQSFQEVWYKNIYKNIDLHYYEHDEGLKYDLIVAPFADITQIKLELKGAEKITLQADGSILIDTKCGALTEGAPIAYQDGKRVEAYWYLKNNTLSFKLPGYDPTKPLIIDPLTRAWGTFYGSEGTINDVFCVTDKSGNVYFGGTTLTFSNFSGLATSGAYQQTYAGGRECFIVKFNSNGVRLWGTYYGGSGNSYIRSAAISPIGELFVVGEADSDFPLSSGCWQSVYGGGPSDLFILKLDSNGMRQWCTFYGDDSWEFVSNCSVTKNGDLLLACNISLNSLNSGTNLATTGTFRDSAFSTTTSLLIKFKNNGTRQWATFYGGYAAGCSVDTLGNTYVVGTSGFDSTLATTGAHQQSVTCAPMAPCTDIYIAKFDSSGNRLWGTFYGGTYYELATTCKVDLNNNLVVVGFVGGEPCNGIHGVTTPGAHRQIFIGHPCAGTVNGIVGKFSSNGTLIWGTYLGAAYTESPMFWDCDIGPDNGIYLCGSAGLNDGLQADLCTNDGYKLSIPYLWPDNANGFLTKLNSNGQLEWGTLYGGVGRDLVQSCSADRFGNVYIAGISSSKDTFELASPGAHDTHMDYGPEGFLVKFSDCQKVSLPTVIDITTPENKTICEGTSATLGVSYMSTVRWFAGVSDNIVLHKGTPYTTPALSKGTYSYYAHGTNNCGQPYPRTLVTVTVSACVGIDEYADNVYALLFPNPADKYIRINSDKESILSLFNSMGELLWERKMQPDISLNIENVSSGIYLAKIVMGSNVYYHKLLVY